MIAPIDARATIDAGEDKVELVLNFRTIALAAAAGVELLAGTITLDAISTVKLLAAFATPAHPGFDEEQAFALMLRHGEACGAAVSTLLTSFAAAAGAEANPPTPRRRKLPAS